MTTVSIGTCPRCLIRVAPLPDGRCPACRAFDFGTSVSDERTLTLARAAARRRLQESIYRAAVLHWRIVCSLGSALALLLLRSAIRTMGAASLIGPFVEPQTAIAALTVLSWIAGLLAVTSSASLARVIRLASAGPRRPGVFTALLESAAFFREHRVDVGLLGPRCPRYPKDSTTMP